MKTIKWGSASDHKNIVKFYQYKLKVEEGEDPQSILSTLAAGESSKLYVSEARYLLGKLHHSKAIQKKKTLTAFDQRKIRDEYNRAIKS